MSDTNPQTEQGLHNVNEEQFKGDTGGPKRQSKYKQSVVEYYGHSSNYCGYCKRDDTESEGRRSYDIKAHALRPEDYQQMLDKGWRRSGSYCYCPINSISCCPNYPLSCDALNFKLSRSQRRCIENLNSYLVNDTTQNRLKLNYENSESCDANLQTSNYTKLFDQLKMSSKARDRRFVNSCERKVKLYNITIDEAIRRTRQKNSQRRSQSATLEDYLFPKTKISSKPLQAKHCLEIKMLYVESNDSKALRNKENELIQRYQKEIHKEEPEEWTMKRFSDFLISSPIIVQSIQQTDMDLHSTSDTLTKESQMDYLLVKPPDLPTAYGTYHCVYFLDGKIIAVGVLDILPKCITTVYFFYEPKYGFLNLGTYSALVEISMVRQMYKLYSSPTRSCKIIYYYLGFYVHECKKMHYKTKFRPSHLLCSETHRYVPTEVCLKLLEGKKYTRFYQFKATSSNNNPENSFNLNENESNMNELIIYDIPVMTPVTNTTKMIDYFDWLAKNLGEDYVRILVENILLKYIELIGAKLVSRIILRLESIHRALVERHRKMTPRPTESKPSTARSI